ncbi:MAG: hypothetical protein AAGM21_12470 [Pseudomonadota bacterium]
MPPKFMDQPYLAEMVAFFCLAVVWALSGFLAAMTVAACADLAISAWAWRRARRKSPGLKSNAGS